MTSPFITSIPHMDCDKPFCLLLYRSHKDALSRFQTLEREHAALQLRHNQLYDHHTTHGAAATSAQQVLPNGDVLSTDTFMQRTRAFEQSRQSVDRMHKELTACQKGLADCRAQLERKTQQARELEKRLNGFQRAQTYAYSCEQHRIAAQDNERLELEAYRAGREVARLKAENAELRRTTVLRRSKVPLVCPYGPCPKYRDRVRSAANPTKFFRDHVARNHKVVCCDVVVLYCLLTTHPASAPTATPASPAPATGTPAPARRTPWRGQRSRASRGPPAGSVPRPSPATPSSSTRTSARRRTTSATCARRAAATTSPSTAAAPTTTVAGPAVVVLCRRVRWWTLRRSPCRRRSPRRWWLGSLDSAERFLPSFSVSLQANKRRKVGVRLA